MYDSISYIVSLKPIIKTVKKQLKFMLRIDKYIMNKALTYMSLLIFLFLLSCNDDLSINDIKTETYLIKYMNYPANVYPSRNSSELTYINMNSDYIKNDSVSIIYDKNKIIKRIGYFLIGNAGLGYPAKYVSYIYDTLIYTNNQLTILTKSNSQDISGVSAYKKVILYENKRISKTIQSFQYTNEDDIAVNYIYTNNHLIRKIGYIGTNLYFQSDFFYNKNYNLDSIVTRESDYNPKNDLFEIDLNSKNRIKEVFEDYDTKTNRLKPFIIFDEIFNRSISTNNYAKYNYYCYDINGIINKEWHYTYNLKYENGLIDFAK